MDANQNYTKIQSHPNRLARIQTNAGEDARKKEPSYLLMRI
jgi:hypothetical protein